MADEIMNTQNTGIVVDDGSVKESIKNKHGDEIGVFYFRPTDIGIIDRYNKVAGDFNVLNSLAALAVTKTTKPKCRP